jgi:hypothetical protein
MQLLRPRPLAATALSLWIGFLACVLGCAQPILAPPKLAQAQLLQSQAAPLADVHRTVTREEPCCHHTRGSHKDSQRVEKISCCPLDATLLQKPDPASFSRASFLIATLTLLISQPALPPSAMALENTSPPLAHSGRDILLQARILRI